MKLKGLHIYLRLLTPDDVSETYVAWMNDNEIIQYLESRWSVQTLETVRTFVQSMSDSPKDFLFGMFLNETHQHIGNIKIGSIHFIHRHGDVGLIIGDKASWGKGIAFEAISLITRYGFEELNLNKLTASMYVQNHGSYKAFLKAGYQDAGCLKQHFYCQGRFVDARLVEKCREEEK